MNPNNSYAEILQQYPQYMTKDQMYKVCHISKRTCLYLLESGLVPNEDSGKKTRRFKIQTADVIQYLEDREINPGLYRPPEGYYKGNGGNMESRRKNELLFPLTKENLLIMRRFYKETLRNQSDVLTVNQVSAIIGYSISSVERWCSRQQLLCFNINQKYMVPKEYLIDFLVSKRFIGISARSKSHKMFNEQINKIIGAAPPDDTK